MQDKERVCMCGFCCFKRGLEGGKEDCGEEEAKAERRVECLKETGAKPNQTGFSILIEKLNLATSWPGCLHSSWVATLLFPLSQYLLHHLPLIISLTHKMTTKHLVHCCDKINFTQQLQKWLLNLKGSEPKKKKKAILKAVHHFSICCLVRASIKNSSVT